MGKWFCTFWSKFIWLMMLAQVGYGQVKPMVQVEGKNISTEEDLVISVSSEQTSTVQEGIPYQFPEINFFRKVGVSRGKASRLVNNQLVNVAIYSQHYRPINAGIFTVPALEVVLFQQSVKIEPFSVTVVKGLESPIKESQLAPFEVPKEVLSNKNKTFLLVSSSEYTPFVGQGFTLKFSLFVPENNVEELEFDRNDLQVPLLLKKLKPSNCWQENFDLQDTKVISTVWQGIKYKEYRFFQSTFYALDNQLIRIPSLNLRLMRVSRKGSEVQKIPIDFKSIAFFIKPKALPKGVSPTKMPVGTYELKETVTKQRAATGDKILYSYQLIGDGNTFAIEEPEVESDYFLRFSTISKEQSVFPFRDKMFGNNSQKIQIIPKQPGKFALRKYFSWIYFNTEKEKVDTLYSSIILDIQGKPEDAKLDTKDESSEIYKGIEKVSTEIDYWNQWSNWKHLVNLLLFVLFLVFIFVLIRIGKK